MYADAAKAVNTFSIFIFCLHFIRRCSSVICMASTATHTTTINFTEAELQIIRKLKRQFEPEHGKQTLASVIRIALRKAVKA
jgi:hypothetical protein